MNRRWKQRLNRSHQDQTSEARLQGIAPAKSPLTTALNTARLPKTGVRFGSEFSGLMGLKQSCLGVCSHSGGARCCSASIGSEECYVSTRGHEERRLLTLIRFWKEKLLLIWLLICCWACERINNHSWPKIRWEGHRDRCWCDLKKLLLRSSSRKSRSNLIPVLKMEQLTTLRATKSRNWKHFS